MKLERLAVVSMMGCLLGLLALAVAGGITLDRVQQTQQQGSLLLELKSRIDNLSIATDALLLHQPDSSLWTAYQADARALQQELEALARDHPAAARAAHHIRLLVETLAGALDQPDVPRGDAGMPTPGSVGPLEVPERSRIILNQVAGHSMALDASLDRLLHQRQAEINRSAHWAIGGFAGAALLFGVICVFAFGLIFRRISGPIRALSRTIDAIEAGDTRTRAPATGEDELADLARAFNGMLDHQQADAARLLEQQLELERRERMLAASQRVARVGSWRRELVSDHLEWSGETYRILGVSPSNFPPTLEAFAALIDEDDRTALLREYHAASGGRKPNVLELRVTRPDGEIRHVQLRSELEYGTDGRLCAISGTIQDITEQHRAEEHLLQYRELVEGSRDLFCVIGSDYRYVMCNQAYADLFGLDRDAVEGMHLRELRGEEFFLKEAKPPIDRCLAGEPQIFEAERTYMNIDTRRILIRYQPVPSPDGVIRQVASVATDLTDLKRAEEELREQAELLQMAGRIARFGGWSVDVASRRCTWSDVVRQIHCRPPDYNPTVEQVLASYAPEYRERIRACYTACSERGIPYDEEAEIITAQGARRWIRTAGAPVYDASGTVIRVDGAFQDVTDRRALLEKLQRQEEYLRRSRNEISRALDTRQALVNSLPAHIALLDRHGTIIDVNQQWRQFAEVGGYPDPDHGVGRNYPEICSRATGSGGDDATAAAAGLRAVLEGRQESFTLEYPCHSPRQRRWFRLMARRLAGGSDDAAQYGAVVMHVDITERKLAEEELNRLAFRDPVTGLLNRPGFMDAFHRRMEESGWDECGMVLMLDLEGHRNVNDAHGYQAGDTLLTEIGQRLQERTGPGAIVGRIGGDEYVLFLPSGGTLSAEQRRRTVASTFAEPFRIGFLRIEAAARFGHTSLGPQRRDAEALLREAELALFEARAGRLRGWAAYTAELDRNVRQRIDTTRELRRALEDHQFELHYQPKVDLETGELIACEALLRWNHPRHGLRPPGLFIPVAEQSQLIGPIGDWALFEACRQLREWRDAGLEVVRIAVNVSVVQFHLGGFTDRVRAAVAAHGVDPASLTLEITESVFARESEALRGQLRELHELGVRLSLDDFGTGYSSLLYLQQYPFDEIKIDMGFVQHVLDDPYSRKIVTTVLGIAGALGAEAVAEGVESTAVRDALLEMGCRTGQGYYYSVPLAAEDVRWLLEKRSPLPLPLVREQRNV